MKENATGLKEVQQALREGLQQQAGKRRAQTAEDDEVD